MSDAEHDTKTPETELRTLYVELRNKHVDQLMEINGKATFAVLALTVSLLTGLPKIPTLPKCYLIAAVISLGFGALFLTMGAFGMSRFHTSHIVKLQKKAANPTPADADDFEIIPSWQKRRIWLYPFAYVFAGCLSLVAFIFVLVIHGLTHQSVPGT